MHAHSDRQLDEHFIILEDLCAKKFQPWPRSEPIKLPHAMQNMNSIGKFHVFSFVFRDQRPDILRQFESMLNIDQLLYMFETGGSAEMTKFTYEKVQNMFMDKAAALDEKTLDYLKSMNQSTWLTNIHATVDPKVAEPFSVVCLGDFWINNCMFNEEVHFQPSSAHFINRFLFFFS